MAKATHFSTVTFELDQICEAAESVQSNILSTGPHGSHVHKMGTAETPVDCYIEIFLSRMLIGEHSRCYIERKTPKKAPIQFTIRIKKIQSRRHLHQLTFEELLKGAAEYKERGVRMFKEWPMHAHVYFSRAYKMLTSVPRYKYIGLYTKEEDGIDGEEVLAMLHTIRYNIAACLLLEERYGDVVNLLQHEDDGRSEKAMYRKAKALYHLKRYEEALGCYAIVKWQGNPAMSALHKQIRDMMSVEKDEYSKIVKKMFQ